MATPEQHPHLNIRHAHEEDAAALREIFNDAVEDGLATFDTVLRSLEEQKRIIAEAERDSRRPVLVAELRNWICGVVCIEPYEEKIHGGEVGEVVVFVRRSFRSYGIGRHLMRVVQTEAVRLRYRKLIGRVLSDNEDSLRLCRACGWRIVGVHERHARHGNHLRDVTILERLLATDSSAE